MRFGTTPTTTTTSSVARRGVVSSFPDVASFVASSVFHHVGDEGDVLVLHDAAWNAPAVLLLPRLPMTVPDPVVVGVPAGTNPAVPVPM